MSRTPLLLAATVSLLSTAVLAEAPGRIRGTVGSLDGTSLHVMAADGRDVAVGLSPDTTVTALVPATLAEIKPGSFVGTAAETQPDGSLVAREVHIFPDSMRGAGEGYRGFDLGPNSTMTNGTVGQEVKGTTGDSLSIAYKGGEKTILVPAGAPIVTFAPGDRAMLVRGAHVIVQAKQGSGGTLAAARITVGKDGLVPPM